MIAALPIQKRPCTPPDVDRADMPDQNGMGMMVECGFELAVQDRERIFKCRRASLEAIPSYPIVAFAALASVKAGKGLRHRLLVGREHVDTEATIPLQHWP